MDIAVGSVKGWFEVAVVFHVRTAVIGCGSLRARGAQPATQAQGASRKLAKCSTPTNTLSSPPSAVRVSQPTQQARKEDRVVHKQTHRSTCPHTNTLLW
jgi:hypothetical protein